MSNLFDDFPDQLSPFIEYIPEDELIERLHDSCSELDPSFLGFPYTYLAVAAHVPRDFEIVDIGSYVAAQAYVFAHFKHYTAIDIYDTSFHAQALSHDDFIYEPPKRFKGAGNVTHITMDGKQWLHEHANDNNAQRYVICSAVPDKELKSYLASKKGCKSYPNLCYWYPGDEIITRGINAESIYQATKH